jgi:hypothetical protein
MADNTIEAGSLAVTMRPVGDPVSTYHIPDGTIVGVTKIHPGRPSRRAVDIVYVHEDEKTIARATVREFDLRACTLSKVD